MFGCLPCVPASLREIPWFQPGEWASDPADQLGEVGTAERGSLLLDLGQVLLLEAPAVGQQAVKETAEFDGSEPTSAGVVLAGELAERVGGGKGHAGTRGLGDDGAADSAEELARQSAQPARGIPFDDLRGDADTHDTKELHDMAAVELHAVGLAHLVHESDLDREDRHRGERVGEEFESAGEEGVVEDGLVEGVGVRSQGRLDGSGWRAGREGGRHGGSDRGSGAFGGGGGGRGELQGRADFVEEPTLGGGRRAVGLADGQTGGPSFLAGGVVGEGGGQFTDGEPAVLDAGEDLVEGRERAWAG